MKTSIRPAIPPDLHTLAHLSRKIFHESFAALNKPENMKEYMDRAFNVQQLLSELENESSEFYFISVGNQTAGYLKINQSPAQSDIQDPASLEIERIYVDASFQGQGLGALLLNKAKQRADELSIDYVWLGVWEKNPAAFRFYEKHGFIKFGNHKFQIGDDLQTDVLMKWVR